MEVRITKIKIIPQNINSKAQEHFLFNLSRVNHWQLLSLPCKFQILSS